MASLCHPGFTTTKLSYRFPIFETSATALCGTTGMDTANGDHIAILDVLDQFLQMVPLLFPVISPRKTEKPGQRVSSIYWQLRVTHGPCRRPADLVQEICLGKKKL